MKANEGYILLERVGEENKSGIIITNDNTPRFKSVSGKHEGKIIYARNVMKLTGNTFYCKEEDVIAYEV